MELRNDRTSFTSIPAWTPSGESDHPGRPRKRASTRFTRPLCREPLRPSVRFPNRESVCAETGDPQQPISAGNRIADLQAGTTVSLMTHLPIGMVRPIPIRPSGVAEIRGRNPGDSTTTQRSFPLSNPTADPPRAPTGAPETPKTTAQNPGPQ
jgi:hypothetical protein